MITYLFLAIFICLMGYMVYFQTVKSEDFINSPYNSRQDTFADRVVRGKIMSADGKVLAETVVDAAGNETRKYPYGNMYAHVVGFSTNGKSGIESNMNFNLLRSHSFVLERMFNEIKDEKSMGDNVVTTLDSTLQETAYQALGNYDGAVVVMEPSTGKVLAMVSKPDFDPNTIAADWDSIISEDNNNSVLLNRATQGLYPPGSTFKIITTLEYIRENPDYENYSYSCNGSITENDFTIHCYNNAVHGTQDLKQSFANSCNSSFANIGLGLDLTQYRQTAEDLLFNKSLPGVLNTAKSSFALDQNSSEGEVMMTAMGQGKTTVSPYHMALIAEAVANGGTMMQPYLVESVTNYTGSQIRKNVPKSYKKVMTSDEAAQLKEYMTAVVEEGTGSVLKGRSYTAAGKTGTAEYSMSDGEKTHSWFMGFTNVDNPDLVISVITEGSDGSSSGKAVAIAGDILDAYYN